MTLFIVLGFSFSLGSYLVVKIRMSEALRDFESESIEAALLRVENALDDDLSSLISIAMEYTSNNQVLNFLQDPASQPPPDSFDPGYLRSIGVDTLTYFNNAGERLTDALGDIAALRENDVESGTFDSLVPRGSIAAGSLKNDMLVGVVMSRQGLLQITSHSLLEASESGATLGRLIVGRLLTNERLNGIGEVSRARVTLHPTLESARVMSDRADGEPLSQVGNETTTSGFHILKDINGKTVGVLEVQAQRRLSAVGNELVRNVTLFMLGLSTLFLVASSLLIRELILEPLRVLKDKILDLRQFGKLNLEVEEGRTDEVGILAGEFAVMMTELTEGKERLEQARDEAVAKSSAKSDFIARMSHEIRTPMSGVLGMTEILRSTPLSTKQRKYTETIYDSAQSLLGVINNILDFSKIEAGKLNLNFVDVQLNALVEEVVEAHAGHAHAQKTELMIVLPRESHSLVKTDPTRLKQVLNNLISNAIKFTQAGEVVVRLTSQPEQNGHQRVFFEVSDSGIGIGPEQQKCIFDSFTQAEESTTRIYGGSGLGLAICQQLIDQMGGELTVESAPHSGSVFSFSLELETSHDIASQTAKQMESVDGKSVLIVDNSSTNRNILEHLLLGWNAVARTAASADEGYAKLIGAMSNCDPYDLVIVDLDMPEKTGFELIRSIRANPRLELLKIIVLSSLARPAREEMFTQYAVAGELSKPVLQSRLYYSLAAVMRHQLIDRPETYSGSSAVKLTGRVLVVEDNEVNRQVALSMLNSMGLEVELAVNGLEAVEKLASESFDLVLMDCQLPVMNGWKATETIRLQEVEANSRRTPIIAATANALKSDREHCLQAGMDDCLIKPFTTEQLYGVLNLYLHSAGEISGESNEKLDFTGNGATENESTAQEIAIDQSTLSRLSLLQQPGSPNIVRKLLSLYLQSSVVIKDRLGNAIDSSNGAVVRESAHALKSSSLNVGATGLAELCKRLESMGRDGTIQDSVSLRESLETEYTRVVTAVESELGSVTS
ncbi:MAG: response regulator [Gammaproteobacteria bacterium]